MFLSLYSMVLPTAVCMVNFGYVPQSVLHDITYRSMHGQLCFCSSVSLLYNITYRSMHGQLWLCSSVCTPWCYLQQYAWSTLVMFLSLYSMVLPTVVCMVNFGYVPQSVLHGVTYRSMHGQLWLCSSVSVLYNITYRSMHGQLWLCSSVCTPWCYLP